MSPHAYAEDQFVERPAIGRLAELARCERGGARGAGVARIWTRVSVLAAWLLAAVCFSTVVCAADELETGFSAPPDSAKPQTWWHWADGNIGKEGITAELEAMRRVGLGGVHMFTVGHYPPVPNPEVPCLSPEWYGMVRHALAECERLGLAFTAQDCAGWTTAGGPWITPDKAMFHVVCERQSVTNGGLVKLPAPPSWPEKGDSYYRDIAVLAFPTPPALLQTAALPAPKVTSGFDGCPELGGLSRSEAQTKKTDGIVCELVSNRTGWVQFEFPEPVLCRSVRLMGGKACIEPDEQRPEVWASEDGQRFKLVVGLSTFVCVYNCAEDGVTHAIPATRARFFRLVWEGPVRLSLKSVEWSSAPTITAHKAQAGEEGRTMIAEPELPEEEGTAVAQDRIVDLTSQLDRQGGLTWSAPAGAWTVLRVGYRGTGKRNAPAPREASGLECDKFSREAVSFHFDQYIGRILAEARAAKSHAMKGVLVDSWEAGTQNWSPVFRDEFRKRRGYDALPYLPAYAGYLVGGREVTRRFLRDARQTGSDLVSENFFGTLQACGRKHGLQLYAESCGGSGAGVMVADGVQHYLHTDIPMTEDGGRPMREAVSAARLTGKSVVAMEAFTQGGGADWSSHPGNLKPGCDGYFCSGISRLVFHTYAHNPDVSRLSPGPAFWKYGLPFSRGQTWWEPGRAWIAYLSRCQFLLQRGKGVADVLCFYGEEPAGPVANVFAKNAPVRDTWRALPKGYDYDLLPAEFMIEGLTMRGGLLAGPDGAAYRLLVLRDSDRMTPEAAAKIRKLVKAGAAVLGPRPQRSPSLSGYPACDGRVLAVGDEVWGDCDGRSVKERRFGKGRVFCGMTVAEALNALALPPDFAYTCGDANANIRYVHRRDGDAEIFFVSKVNDGVAEVEAAFRVVGKLPELWDPVTGEVREASAFHQENGRTFLPLVLGRNESLFVVFRKPISPDERGAGRDNRRELAVAMALKGPWSVAFAGWGAPASITFDGLEDWTRRAEESIRYYSGTAVYRTEFEWAGAASPSVALDLGTVGVIAEVFVNCAPCGIAWTPPYRVAIGRALRPGRNALEVRVSNTWANRLIGDARLPESERRTWTTYHGFTPETPVGSFRSGLLGPVTVAEPPAHGAPVVGK